MLFAVCSFMAGISLAAIASADSRDFTIRVLPHGTEMEFSGHVTFGASSALRDMLDANPGVKVLHLSSNGGSVGDARQMQVLVHERGLTTVIDTHCMSACAFVFLGGRERYLAPGAKLGFHREKAAGVSPAEINMMEEADAQFMLSMGIAASFVDKAFSTPSNDIWIPTVAELKAANVITDVSDSFQMPDDAKPPATLAEQLLGENPFKNLQARDPDRYKSLHDRLIQAMGNRASLPDVESLPTADVAPLSLASLSRASDALAVEFTQAFEAYLVKVGEKNPDECYFIFYPERAPADFGVSDVLAGDDLANFADVQARLVSDAALRNAPAPSQKDVAAAEDAMSRLFQERNPGMATTMSQLDSPTADHGAVCSAMTEMLAIILTLPDGQRGPLLRYIFGPS